MMLKDYKPIEYIKLNNKKYLINRKEGRQGRTVEHMENKEKDSTLNSTISIIKWKWTKCPH